MRTPIRRDGTVPQFGERYKARPTTGERHESSGLRRDVASTSSTIELVGDPVLREESPTPQSFGSHGLQPAKSRRFDEREAQPGRNWSFPRRTPSSPALLSSDSSGSCRQHALIQRGTCTSPKGANAEAAVLRCRHPSTRATQGGRRLQWGPLRNEHIRHFTSYAVGTSSWAVRPSSARSDHRRQDHDDRTDPTECHRRFKGRPKTSSSSTHT